MSDVLEKLKEASVRRLREMLDGALTNAQSSGLLALRQHKDEVLHAFVRNMNDYFDELMGKAVRRPEPVFNFENLSLVQDADLEMMVALEGMVNAARNTQLPSYISLNTRLGTLFTDKRIDESTNPLDPSQISEAFKEAITPLGLNASAGLSIYRQFNADILRSLDQVLAEANELLVKDGVIPNLGMDGIRKRRPTARLNPRPQDATNQFGTVEEVAYEAKDENPELFSMMQNLMHPDATPKQDASAGAQASPAPAGTASQSQQYAVPASLLASGQAQPGPMQAFVPSQGQLVQMVDQGRLMDILSRIQATLEERQRADHESDDVEDHGKPEKLNISSTLGEMLQEDQAEGVVNAVDRQSSDIINLVTLLYEAIWDDESLPIPIKELIGRTQITIIKVALSDTTFFNKENHPARTVLNDFAEAGIGWTEVEELKQDPLYNKIQDLVHKILNEYNGELSFFEDIVKEFRAFRAKEAAKTRMLEQRIMRAKERQDRLEDINRLVTEKIEERVLGRDLDPFINEVLEQPFHKFMVMLVLKEGPGTSAWKQAINTVDVLLWTVQLHDQDDDRQRLETVNPRLLNNLRKAFRIAQIPSDEIDAMIARLKQLQASTFSERLQPAEQATITEDQEAEVLEAETPAPPSVPEREEEELSEDDPNLQQVDNLHVGVWVEFAGEGDVSVRCKLGAKISAIDKYIFVNRQGVKVVEKSRMGLARELKDGTVKFISDGLMFSRALESVIGTLREAQREQQTGNAYRPATRA